MAFVEVPSTINSVGGFLLDRLESFGLVRAVDAESHTVDVVASTEDVARDGMVIRAAGWQWEQYGRNPVVLWSHNDREMPLARATRTAVEGRALVQTHEFDPDDERSMAVFRKVQRGFINAVSVRWDPLEAGFERIDGQEIFVFRRQELLETSYVSVPADAGALVVRADGSRFEKGQSPAERLVEEERERQERLTRFANVLERTTEKIRGG